MKPHLLAPLLLASCAASGPGPGSEKEDMERKLIAFQEKYDRFDYDGSGYLTPPEVSSGLVSEQVEGIGPEDVPRIFVYYDTNRDGRISLKEINTAQAAGAEAALRAQAAF